MRINQIYIEDLFEMFTYNINLHLEEKITIIHGPNGYGKTTILKMIDALFNDNLQVFFKIPFKKFVLSFDNGDTLKIEKEELTKKKDKEVVSYMLLNISMGNGKYKAFKIDYFPMFLRSKEEMSFKRYLLNKKNYIVFDASRDLWMHGPTDEVLTYDEILERDGYRVFSRSKKDKREEWFTELIKKFEVVFIETQRLMVKENMSKQRYRKRYMLKSSVKMYSENLKDLIKKTLTEYAELSQSLDRSFPSRVVKIKPVLILNEEEIHLRLSTLEEKRRSLMDVGLLDKDSSMVTDIEMDKIDDSTVYVLNVYINDTESKLAIFDDLYEKINLYLSTLNERFLNKHLTISKQDGFVVTTENGRKLDLEDLSSGEKHEIVLLYEMLFNAKPNSFILIDEPEISFHVEWQEVFLDNLLKIARISNLDILVATHSPQIINDKWDLTVRLE